MSIEETSQRIQDNFSLEDYFRDKIELESLEEWSEILPGLAPDSRREEIRFYADHSDVIDDIFTTYRTVKGDISKDFDLDQVSEYISVDNLSPADAVFISGIRLLQKEDGLKANFNQVKLHSIKHLKELGQAPSNVFLQHLGRQNNEENSLEEPLSVQEFSEILSEEEKRNIPESFWLWGVPPGSQNERYYEKMDVGDLVLFFKDGEYKYKGVVWFKSGNDQLSKEVWGEETWERVYFLKNVEQISVPKKEINSALGYEEDYYPQGLIRTSDPDLGELLDALGDLDMDQTKNADGYFWVNQTRDVELENGVLRAPADTNAPGHQLDKISRDSIIIHCDNRGGDRKIIGFSTPQSDVETVKENGEKFYKLDVDLERFDEPFSLGRVVDYLMVDQEEKYFPLTREGNLAQRYLSDLTPRTGKFILEFAKNPEKARKEFKQRHLGDESVSLDLKEPLKVELSTEILDGLYFPEGEDEKLINQVQAALNSGKHIIFTGPPGTGKTEVARQVAEHLADKRDDLYTGIDLTTATSDWSTFDTVGGYMPDQSESSDQLTFRPGHVLKRFKQERQQRNDLLVIDEINRADIDKAFGQLFTILSGQKVTLPFQKEGKEVEIQPIQKSEEDTEIPKNPGPHQYLQPASWRIFATMNTYDKTSLYEMSYAFMRRFAFIQVDVPEDAHEDLDSYIEVWGMKDKVNDDMRDNVADVWRTMNQTGEQRKIGPALVKDMLEFMVHSEGDLETRLTQATINYIYPQLEGVRNRGKIVRELKELFGSKSSHERLEQVAEDMLQVEPDE